MRTASWALTVLAASAALACTRPETEVGTVFDDSAGVALADAHAPAWVGDAAWTVSDRPVIEIGSAAGEPAYLFSDVVGGRRLSDGRVAVADRGSGEIRFFDANGRFLSRTGGEGDGPGEFQSLDFIGLRLDSIVAFDARLSRVQVFSPTGEFTRMLRLESPWPTASPEAAIEMVDGRILALRFLEWGDEVPDGVARWPHERLVTLDLDTGELRSLRTVRGYEAAVERREGGGYSHGQYLFAKGNEFAAGMGRIAVAVTDTFRVEVLSPSGALERVIRRTAVTPPSTSTTDLEAFVDTVVGLVFPEGTDADPEDIDNYRRIRMNTPMAPTRPVMRSLRIDADGNVWIEPFFQFGEEPAPYWVFDRAGAWLGDVSLPPGLDRGSHPVQAPALEIGSDYVLGVWVDELDVERVRLYRLEKPGSAPDV